MIFSLILLSPALYRSVRRPNGRRPKFTYPDFNPLFPSFALHSSVRNLGVVLDSTLTFSEHVANLTRSSYFHLRRLRAIRRSVSSHVFTSIVHAFVCSRIDYCNSLLV